MYEYSPLLHKIYPTFDELFRLMSNASRIDYINRDPRPYLYALNRMTEVNGRIRGHIYTRSAAIRSWDWNIISTDKKNTILADNALNRLRPVINMILKYYVRCPLYGCFGIGLTWNFIEGIGNVPTPKAYDIYSLEQVGDGVMLLSDDGLLKKSALIRPEDGNNSIIFATDGLMYAGGALRSVSIREVLLLMAQLEWANFIKKIKGIIQGILQAGATVEERNVVEEVLRNVARNEYILTDELVQFKFEQVTGGSGQSFKEFVDGINNDNAIAILGQANTPQLPSSGGSYAALKVQLMVSDAISWQDINGIESVINEQLLKYDYALNSGTGDIPYEFKFDISEEKDKEKEMAVITEALKAGIKLKLSEVYANIGYTEPIEGDGILEPIPSLGSIPTQSSLNPPATIGA